MTVGYRIEHSDNVAEPRLEDLAAALIFSDRDPAGAALEAMALEFLKERQIEIYTVEDVERDLAALNQYCPRNDCCW